MFEGVVQTSPIETSTHHRRTLFVQKSHSFDDIDDEEEEEDDDGSGFVPIRINVVDDNSPPESLSTMIVRVPSSSPHNNNNHTTSSFESSSCHCFEHYRESMPKDIAPPTTNSEKNRNKFVEELFPTAQGSQICSGQKERRTKIRQQKSRFRTTPVTFEELREADEEIYLKQQKDEPQTESDSAEFRYDKGGFRQKSWTFSGGSTTTSNNRRSPSPTRRSSWHLQPLTNLHPLNWRPLSNESLLHLNSLSTLPTIQEEERHRLLNSPMTPSNDNFPNIVGSLTNSTTAVEQTKTDVLNV